MIRLHLYDWVIHIFSIILGAAIQGPSIVIYFPGQETIQLACSITQGSTGWSVNGQPAVSLTGIDANGIPGHSRNGTNLVINTPVNNTEYACVSIRDDRDVFSDPAYLYIAGEYVT